MKNSQSRTQDEMQKHKI